MNEPLRAQRDASRERRRHLDAAPDTRGHRRGARSQWADQTQPVGGGAAGRRLPADAVPLVRLQGGTARRVRGLRAARCSTPESSRATAGLRGTEKLDAALRFIVEYQQSYSGVRLVDIEPEVVIAQLARSFRSCARACCKLLPGPNGAVKAATAIRVAVSHYMVRSDDDDQFLAQLRHAVGMKNTG